MLPGELSDGSCPWCWIYPWLLFSLFLSFPQPPSLCQSVSICLEPVCKHTLPMSLKTVKARLQQPPPLHNDYNVSGGWNIGNCCVHSVSSCSQYVLFTVSVQALKVSWQKTNNIAMTDPDRCQLHSTTTTSAFTLSLQAHRVTPWWGLLLKIDLLGCNLLKIYRRMKKIPRLLNTD